MSNNPSKSTELGDNQKGSGNLIIYKATNLLNGKVYIGQTTNSLKYRKEQHIREAKCAKRKSVYFHNAINKYGEVNFSFEEIDSAETIDELNEKEQYWIKFYHSTDKRYGYNLDSGGLNGREKSEETKKKIGETTKAKWRDPIIAEKMLNGLRKGIATQKSKPPKIKTFICEYCGKCITVPAYEISKRKYCSNQCVANANKWKKGVEKAAVITHQRNAIKKSMMKEDIVNWVNNNKELVLNCPKNKIRSTLSGLIDMIEDKYKIKDFRSIFSCFDNVTNMKTFLQELKNIIPEENVC